MNNVPANVMGLLAVSRDCFPAELSRKRRGLVAAACAAVKVPVVELETIVENSGVPYRREYIS